LSTITLARRVYGKINRHLLNSLGRDSVTLEKISRHRRTERIGTRYGGWTIPGGVLNQHSVCYCVGCGEDISFDLGLIERYGCQVFAYDPTPRAIAHVRQAAAGVPAYRFFDVGVWNHDDMLKFFAPRNPNHVSHSLVNLQHTEQFIEVKVARLNRLMQANGHDRLDLLKLDIEGAEYVVLDSILQDRIPIKVLCVEFDEFWHPQDSNARARIRKYVKTLMADGYELLSADGNANYSFVKDG
jgi:FkbM family methyltransferase